MMIRALLTALMFSTVAAAAPLKVNGMAEFHATSTAPGGIGTLRIHGTGAAVTGTLNIADGMVSGELELPMGAWTTEGSIPDPLGARDKHFREVFETAKYPKATLKLDPAPIASVALAIKGSLTLKTDSAPANGTCTVQMSGGAPGYVADCELQIDLDRYPSVPKIERLGAVVSRQVKVEVHLKASP